MDEKAHYKAGLFIYLEHGAPRASPWYLHVLAESAEVALPVNDGQ
jgi:hypothetical protein